MAQHELFSIITSCSLMEGYWVLSFFNWEIKLWLFQGDHQTVNSFIAAGRPDTSYNLMVQRGIRAIQFQSLKMRLNPILANKKIMWRPVRQALVDYLRTLSPSY